MHLAKIIREHKGFLDVVSSMSGSKWSRGTPFLISDSGIMLLSDILGASSSFKRCNLTVFNKGYDVVFMEILLSYCKTDHKDVCKDLFGKKTDDVEY